MYFCFRWVLIMFKREFNFPEVMRLWEVLWTDKPCLNFHLLICLSILDTEKTTLMENHFGFTEILKVGLFTRFWSIMMMLKIKGPPRLEFETTVG